VPTRTDLTNTAQLLKDRLGDRAFLTIERSAVTEILRDESGSPATQLKHRLAQALTDILCSQGIQIFPPLTATSSRDHVRLYRTGTLTADLVDVITNPDPGRDWYLADSLTKIKGKWAWAQGGLIS
jgi:hypothetical protein